MLQTDAQDTVFNLTFLGALLFIIGYTIRAPWWRYRVGRVVVSLDIGWVITLLPGILQLWFHVNTATPFFSWYEIAAFFVVFLITVWRLYTIDRVQRHIDPPTPDPVPETPRKEEVE